MESFTSNQERMRQSMQESFGGMFPFGNMEEMSRQNLALFENAMKVFAPFKNEPAADTDSSPESGPDSGTGNTDNGAQELGEADSLETLKAQVDLLQKQLDAFGRGSSKN
jgi:polyhydroxyalkanoate synthesis regulator protein